MFNSYVEAFPEDPGSTSPKPVSVDRPQKLRTLMGRPCTKTDSHRVSMPATKRSETAHDGPRPRSENNEESPLLNRPKTPRHRPPGSVQGAFASICLARPRRAAATPLEAAAQDRPRSFLPPQEDGVPLELLILAQSGHDYCIGVKYLSFF